LTPSDVAGRGLGRRLVNELIADPLVVALPVIVVDELTYQVAKVPLTQRQDPIQAFLFDRPHKAFCVGIAVRRRGSASSSEEQPAFQKDRSGDQLERRQRAISIPTSPRSPERPTNAVPVSDADGYGLAGFLREQQLSPPHRTRKALRSLVF
jgi:hypothetical protein